MPHCALSSLSARSFCNRHFLAAAALYGGYYLTTKLDVEYEYIFTNGEIDVDKITAQRSRKRLITFRCGSATDFGIADENFSVPEGATQVLACACDDSLTDYYITFNHKISDLQLLSSHQMMICLSL